MSYGMYLAAEGAQAQSRRLEVIANNMANVDTVGFKPDVAAFQARFAEAIQKGLVSPGSRTQNDLGGGVKAIETRTDFTAGKLTRTGNDADVALVGDGFFQVEGPAGERLLTRAGNFAVDAQNRLVMAGSGSPVLSLGGGPVEVNPAEPWLVTSDGAVQQGEELTPLAIVEPNSLDELNKVGANLFQARGEVSPVPAERRSVRGGFLEMSGANSTQQMLEMIETTRAYEANTEMIRHQDTATGSLIARVLGGR
ncbi:MAG: flagellar hook-basal body protein [Lacipirellulaceae bacterium]